MVRNGGGSSLTLKQQIYETAKKDLSLIERCKEGIMLEYGTDDYWQALLRRVQEAMKPKRVKRTPNNPLTDEQKKCYRDAKYAYQANEFPNWVKDGHFLEPDYPNTATSNGLIQFIVDYLNWTGCNATRINNMGVQRDGKWTKSTTRKGVGDVSSTIRGRSVKFEIKAGRDRPSEAQLKEQQRERKAGGEYFFTHSVEEFFQQLASLSEQKELF